VQKKQYQLLVADRISLFSIFQILFRYSPEKIFYFDQLTPHAKRLLSIFQSLRLITGEVNKVKSYIGQVKNNKGDIELPRLRGFARTITNKIKQEHLINNPLINSLGSDWNTKKVVLFFEKRIEQQLGVECLRIGLVKWMFEQQSNMGSSNQLILLLKRQQWYSYLKQHAESEGIDLNYYRSFDLVKLRHVLSQSFRMICKLLIPSWNVLFKHFHRLVTFGEDRKSRKSIEMPSSSSIAINYSYRKLSFDPTERSEFFWVDSADIPLEDLLVYNYFSDTALDSKVLSQINEHGISILGQSPEFQSQYPKLDFLKFLIVVLSKITHKTLLCWAFQKRPSLYFFTSLIELAKDYSFWFSFFKTNNVLVNIGTQNTTVGQVLALDKLGGVSMAYQYSSGIGLSPPTIITSGENVQFVFSSKFESVFHRIEPTQDCFVHTGFIYDSAFRAVQNLERISQNRNMLKKNGAEFIVCFFDENSLNRWDIFHSDDDAASDYEFLLRWLLDDPKLGLIFKPKVSTNIFKRIKSISGLIDGALKTGRCKFLTSDTIVGGIFPAEAALMADICIGWLTGSTAALEAHLAGTKSVMIDLVGINSDAYCWGENSVIFKTWENLQNAIFKYRSDPNAWPEFGDWSAGLDDYDQFRDGQASLRMGQFISWIYRSLKRGDSKQEALTSAIENYRKQWGYDSISCERSVK